MGGGILFLLIKRKSCRVERGWLVLVGSSQRHTGVEYMWEEKKEKMPGRNAWPHAVRIWGDPLWI
jgi:hypothetical protein